MTAIPSVNSSARRPRTRPTRWASWRAASRETGRHRRRHRHAVRHPRKHLPGGQLAGRHHLHQCPGSGDHARGGADGSCRDIFAKASTAREFLVAFPSFTDPAHLSTLPEATKSGNGLCVDRQDRIPRPWEAWLPEGRHPCPTGRELPYSFFLVDLSDKGRSEERSRLQPWACMPAPPWTSPSRESTAELIGEEGQGQGLFRAGLPEDARGCGGHERRHHEGLAQRGTGLRQGALPGRPRDHSTGAR